MSADSSGGAILGGSAIFGPGDRVRISERYPASHHRTPWYIKGKTGRVDVVYDAYMNPESRAYGRAGLPRVTVYRVEFAQADLWESYRGPANDRICADVFEHWLEPA